MKTSNPEGYCLSISVQQIIGVNAFLNSVNEVKALYGISFKEAFYIAGSLLEHTLYNTMV